MNVEVLEALLDDTKSICMWNLHGCILCTSSATDLHCLEIRNLLNKIYCAYVLDTSPLVLNKQNSCVMDRLPINIKVPHLSCLD